MGWHLQASIVLAPPDGRRRGTALLLGTIYRRGGGGVRDGGRGEGRATKSDRAACRVARPACCVAWWPGMAAGLTDRRAGMARKKFRPIPGKAACDSDTKGPSGARARPKRAFQLVVDAHSRHLCTASGSFDPYLHVAFAKNGQKIIRPVSARPMTAHVSMVALAFRCSSGVPEPSIRAAETKARAG